jgi:single-strand DNA-binding protein
VTVVGNLVTDVDRHRLNDGTALAKFRIGSTERRFDKAEEKWVEGATNWYSVSAFRQLADHASRSFRKGDRVFVTGRLRLRDWETGAKKGVTAQIDADALGHDLRWGTTTFHRTSASSSPEAPTQDAAWTAVLADDADESVSGDDRGEVALAGAGAAVGADSPF